MRDLDSSLGGKSAVAPRQDGPLLNPTERKKEMRKQKRERGATYEREGEKMG